MRHTRHRSGARRAEKPLLSTYGQTSRRRGHVFSTTQAAHRRRRRRIVIGTVLLVAVAGAAAYAWAWSRPVSLTITAQPSDAVIALAPAAATADSTSATGTLDVGALPAGVYRATVSRSGYETRTVTVEAARLTGGRADVALAPLPHAVRVSASPRTATVRLLRDGTELARTEGSYSDTLPAGPLDIVISADGRNTYKESVFLDGPLALEVRLDPEGQVVHGLGVIGCGGAPKGVALTPDGREAWATILNGPPSIEIFDPASGRRTGEVDLGKHGAVEIVFSRDGRRAYASQMETAKVYEIDTASRKVIRSFRTGSAWTKVVALSPDEKTLYAANWSGDDVSEIDLGSGRLRRRIPVADTPRGLWPSADGRTLWVASFGTGELERVDLASGTVQSVFRSPGGALRHLVADESRGLLFASDMAKDRVWVTDMASGETKRFAKVGHKPNTIDLSPDGKVLFVSNRGANNPVSYYLPGPEWGSVMLIDARTGKMLDGIVGGNQCTALDVSADGRTLVFSDFLDDRLRVYEVPEHAVFASGGGGRSATLARDIRK